jgi:plastocyanin
MRTLSLALIGLLSLFAIAGCTGATTSSPPGSAASGAPSAAEASGSGAVAGATSSAGTGAPAECAMVDISGQATPADVEATMMDLAFEPDPVTASVGQVIQWTNGDDAVHTVTLDDGSCSLGRLGPGASGALQFDSAGSFTYHCEVHPNMTGTIEVS